MSNRLSSSRRGSLRRFSVRGVRGSLAEARGGVRTCAGANFGGGWVVGKVVLEGKPHAAQGVWVTESGVVGVGGWAGMSQSQAGVGVPGVMVVTTNWAIVAETSILWL